MNIKQIPAKAISYGGTRALSAIKAIVIHYTGGTNDTAENEGNYFKNGNTRSAGAHFFVGQDGAVVQSIALERTAWAVGGARYSDYQKTGGAKYYGTYKNANTVSIELCDNTTKDPSDKQVASVRELIAHIRKNCPNAKQIVRHFDITGKSCPLRMCNDSAWNNFLSRIGNTQTAAQTASNASNGKTSVSASKSGYTVKITASVLNVRKEPNSKAKITAKIKKGEVYTIVDESNGWGKLKSGAGWIYLRYTKRN